MPTARTGDTPPVPVELDRVVAAFALHDAATARHLQLLGRLEAVSRENAQLRGSMVRLLEHTASARAELAVLRDVVAEYTRALRESGAPPERAIIAVKVALNDAVDRLPEIERPDDRMRLTADMTTVAIQAYYQ